MCGHGWQLPILVLPVHTGMIPDFFMVFDTLYGAPRAYGDDPPACYEAGFLDPCSPCIRG